jgi:polyisoprenoid-binding protein YceI
MTSQTRRPVTLIAATIAIVLLIAGAFGLWYLFFRPAGPAAVGSTAAPLPSVAAGASAGPRTGGIGGTWKVDTSIGSFSDFSDSFVGYRIQEELAGIGGNEVVGRTPAVSGSMTVAGTQVTDATIEADLTGLTTDDSNRDRQLARQGIQTGQFPTATFKLTSPIELGSIPADGRSVDVKAKGQFTLHGQTRDVEVPMKATLSGDSVVLTGSLPIVLADYGIDKPNSFKVLSIADSGTMELQIYFAKS